MDSLRNRTTTDLRRLIETSHHPLPLHDVAMLVGVGCRTWKSRWRDFQ